MTFNDIFKSDFLSKINSVSITDMLITLALAFAVGIFIFFVYKKTFRGVMYSSSFGVTLIALTMITSQVILAVTSNAVLSLGMVGALSIVRFRTAIKEPLDIAFLFWSIAAGIILAAGFIPLAVIGSVVIGVILLVFVNRKQFSKPYILILTCEDAQSEKEAFDIVKAEVKKASVKSKSVQNGRIEVNAEICLKSENTDFVNRISAVNGVMNATLVSCNGDFSA